MVEAIKNRQIASDSRYEITSGSISDAQESVEELTTDGSCTPDGSAGSERSVRVPSRIVNGPREVSLARRRYQRGTLLLLGSKTEPRWYARFYEDVLTSSGQVHRIRRQEFLGTKQSFPTKKLAMRELDTKLGGINSPASDASL